MRPFRSIGLLVVLTAALSYAKNFEDYPLLETTDNIPWEFEMPSRLGVFGDIHSDPDALATLAESTRFIDRNGHWIAGQDELVLVGDIVGKGPYSRATWDLLLHLKSEAEKAGGRVHVLIGNHELSIQGGAYLLHYGQDDLDYYESYAEPLTLETLAALREKKKKILKALGREYTATDEEEIILMNRKERLLRAMGRAWSEDGSPYAEELRTRNSILKIGDWAFVHGGLDNFLEDGPKERVGQINATYRNLVVAIQKNLLGDKNAMKEFEELEWLLKKADNGPMWTRRCADEQYPKAKLKAQLDMLNARAIFFGHTPTESRHIETLYGGLAYDVDSGISRAIERGTLSAVILRKGSTQVEKIEHIARTTLHPLAQRFRERYRRNADSGNGTLRNILRNCAQWLAG